ncbi:MAG: bifunctional 4-hydroxy-2-oxoglutarate aldolase/2-dehydro-3-deoxy-phosphogluconate aldolase [Lishizhenia sp.]
MQNNIENILRKHTVIPVATIENSSQIDEYYTLLKTNNIYCIEITLRTSFAWEAISLFKQKYGSEFSVGVGTITNPADVNKCIEIGVDFIVSPGTSTELSASLNNCGIPFLPGVATPSEIISGLNNGWSYFKFFPANLFGGRDALKVYSAIFSAAYFCPTGGINHDNYTSFLELPNVLAVGGSWVFKNN